MHERKLLLILLLLKLDVKLLAHELREDLNLSLSECFAKADATPTMEWTPGVNVTLFARWGQAEIVAVIKPLRKELSRSLPLLRIISNCLEIDAQGIARLEGVLTELYLFPRRVEVTDRSGRSVP